jgi:hypothetical protein
MQVVVDTGSLTRSVKGQIAGTVYTEIGGVAFPDDQWSDLVVVVLEWWLSALCELTTGIRSIAEFHFMDGPFSFTVIPDKSGHYPTGFFRGSILQSSANVQLRDFADSLIKAAREVDRACFELKWHSPDVAQLRATIRKVDQLRRALN